MKLFSRAKSVRLGNSTDQIIFLMIANAVFLFLVSYLQIFFNSDSFSIILWSLIIFFIFGVVCFVSLIQANMVFSPIAWFVFGTSVFFGLGGIAGLLQVHSWTSQLFSDNYQYALNNGLLNGGSVAIVLLVGWMISSLLNKKFNLNQDGYLCFEYFKNKFFFVLFALVGMLLLKKISAFYDSYIMQSLFSKILLFQPFLFLILGSLWGSCNFRRKLLSCSIIFLATASAFLETSKYEVFLVLISFMLGLWVIQKDMRFRLQSLIIICSFFVFINPIVTSQRSLDGNSFEDLIMKLQDPTMALSNILSALPLDSDVRTKFKNNDPILNSNFSEKFLFPALRRLDTSTIQGYLIERYQQGNPGDSMSEIWMLFIPRVIWKDKPVITRHGRELYKEFYNDPISASSVGPTYSGEAYWNYGVIGVLNVSILFGIILGFFEWMSKSRLYYLLAIPVISLAINLEAWFSSIVLGNTIIYISIYMFFFIIKKRFNFGC